MVKMPTDSSVRTIIRFVFRMVRLIDSVSWYYFQGIEAMPNPKKVYDRRSLPPVFIEKT